MIVGRPVMPANSFALAWIIVACVNPTDIFTAGCQLSFLAVAVLLWGTRSLEHEVDDPLAQLIYEARPLWQRALRTILGWLVLSYTVNLAVWLAVTPLVAARYHIVSPIALVIGPPLEAVRKPTLP
jgi:competence protein ComEC